MYITVVLMLKLSLWENVACGCGLDIALGFTLCSHFLSGKQICLDYWSFTVIYLTPYDSISLSSAGGWKSQMVVPVCVCVCVCVGVK